ATPLVTWWRHDDANRPITATLDAAFLSHGEVMAAAFDAQTTTWTAPVVLGTPGVLDYAPIAAGNGVDDAFVAWRANVAGQLNGFGDTADDVFVRRYDPATKTWAAAEKLFTRRGIVSMRAADGATDAAIVYAIDEDGDAATAFDTEIYLQRRVAAGVWQPAQRLTTNAVADLDAQIAFRGNGTPVLVWLQVDADDNRSLVYQEGWSGTPQATPLHGDLAPVSLADLAINSVGDVLVLWRNLYDAAPGTLQNDLTFAIRRAGTWSEPLRLSEDADYERALSVLWRGDDRIAAVYQRMPDGAAQAIQYVETPVTAADAAISHADIVLDPPNPAPGAPVTATVRLRNLGMLAQSNVTVIFSERDALNHAEKRVIASQTVPLLRGGEIAPVHLNYNTSAGATELAVALTCGGPCGNAHNDSAVTPGSLPDLQLTGADVVNAGGAPVVRASVVNNGVISATMVAMTVTANLDGVETELGSSLFKMSAVDGLQPGQSALGEFILDTADVISGSTPLTVTVSPVFGLNDFAEGDNTVQIEWVRRPNLSLRSDFVDTTTASNQTTVTLTVFNHSYLPTPATTVTAYTARPENGGAVLGTGVVPALDPYTEVPVTFTVPGAVDGVWLRANADKLFAELSRADNDVSTILPESAEAPESVLYLPVVAR
ncbi:MAG: hypothetical protein KDD84_10195, partial [Caldilineaceae bacterium]|nr:hypothetical protein [Caldilineaceae bacterium]